MENKVVIRVSNVSKRFKLYLDKGSMLKERLLFRNRRSYEERKVLQDISFEVHQGEAIGLIGENGCGKSTMLKLLSGIMYPEHGRIDIKGRISALIELGAGFHPDLSGRENIYTNAAIFGLTKSEIDKRLQTIIDFSELGEYIENPVRTYSSGMYMRLAFSIAINVDADVLLIDEILAVGDANFQIKCFQKLREIKARGTTIVIVSHDLGTIQSFCDTAMWICDGHAAAYGNSKDVVESYRQYMNEKYLASIKQQEAQAKVENTVEQTVPEESVPQEQAEPATETAQNETAQQADYTANRFGSRTIEITNVIFRNSAGDEIQTLIGGEPVDFDICYQVHEPIDEYNFGMGFFTMDNVCLYGVNTQYDGVTVKLAKDSGFIRFHVEKLELLTGQYYFQCAVVDLAGMPLDYYRRYRDFSVKANIMAIGCSNVSHVWEIH